jgi:hypothetical protein
VLPLGREFALFGSKTILIADGSTYAALDLSAAVEESEGCVAGPVDTLYEAMTILESGGVCGAIVDCELPNASTLIMRLAETGVPVVVQTSIPLPAALEALDGRLSVVMRPIDAQTVIDTLAGEMEKAELRTM